MNMDYNAGPFEPKSARGPSGVGSAAGLCIARATGVGSAAGLCIALATGVGSAAGLCIARATGVGAGVLLDAGTRYARPGRDEALTARGARPRAGTSV